MRRTVTVIMTVKNDPSGCALTLDTLASQTREADEIIVVDGGSTDGTVEVIRAYAVSIPRLQVIEAPGTNIARGRNIAARAARSDIIACTDSGCRAEPDWLEKLVQPLEENPKVEFVAGFYRIDAHTLLEEVAGLATTRGQLDPVCPETFNPSARSMACTKAVWSKAGGWPEWIGFSEDTLFDHKVRVMNVAWHFSGDAIVHWRPRGSLWAIGRQFYNYGTGRGHTQIGASGFIYNLRNVAVILLTAGLCFITVWMVPALIVLTAYFYVWTFHHKALRIARRTRRRLAYPLCLAVTWVVLASNLFGYLVGSWQRRQDRARYRDRMEAYLAGT